MGICKKTLCGSSLSEWRWTAYSVISFCTGGCFTVWKVPGSDWEVLHHWLPLSIWVPGRTHPGEVILWTLSRERRRFGFIWAKSPVKSSSRTEIIHSDHIRGSPYFCFKSVPWGSPFLLWQSPPFVWEPPSKNIPRTRKHLIFTNSSPFNLCSGGSVLWTCVVQPHTKLCQALEYIIEKGLGSCPGIPSCLVFWPKYPRIVSQTFLNILTVHKPLRENLLTSFFYREP